MDRSSLAMLSSVFALAILAPLSLAGQSAKWSAPRTPWGDPDLMGTYTNKTFTPVQRPPEFGDREFLTKEEVAKIEQERVARNKALDDAPAERTVAGGVATRRAHERGDGSATGYYNNFWLDWGTKSTGRTSILVDPPNGRIPPMTPEFERYAAERQQAVLARGVPKTGWVVTGNGLADSWLDFQLNDRCIVWSAGPPMMPGPYNNTYVIFQAPGYVAIQVEMIHDARIIPLDGRPHLSSTIRQWLGDMRGRWEGDTLVVETTNIRRTEGEGGAQGNDEFETRVPNGRTDDTLRVVERFTRVSDDTIDYRFTIEDPSHWTRPFSGEYPFVKTDEKLYEYACHEGNYSMRNMLTGARHQEQLARPSSR
jgi:hypothetical protein